MPVFLFPYTNEEEKLKFYITSFSFCLYNSACPLQSLDHVGHSFRKWGLEILGTGVYLTHPCQALCSRPAPANLLNHACPGQASPFPILTTVSACTKPLSSNQLINS